MNCEVSRCGGTATRHLLFDAGGNVGTACVCGPCLLATLAGCAVALGHPVDHKADHRLDAPCKHPDGGWADDGCRIDGLEILTWATERADA